MGRELMIGLMGMALLVAFVAAARADTVVPTDRVVAGAIVREAPDSDSQPIGMLRPGEAAEYLSDAPHRFHVRLPNGVEGYVSKAWTRRVPAAVVPAANNNLEISFIDVGQGDSTLVICPNGRTILVDAGSTSDPQEEEIRDYVLSRLDQHERAINTLVITHPDKDHYNLLPELLRDIPIDRVYRVGDVEDYMASFRGWRPAFDQSIVTVLHADDHDAKDHPNANIDCGEAKVWILAAAIEATESAKNAMSIVLMIRYGDFEVVLTGDATHDTENAIMARYPANWLDVDLLKIGHHGSLATSTSVAWVAAIRPEYAVVSAALENGYGHPRKEVIERVALHTIDTDPHAMRYVTRAQGAYDFENVENYREAIYATAMSGNIIVTSDGSGFSVKTAFLEE